MLVAPERREEVEVDREAAETKVMHFEGTRGCVGC